MKTTRKQREAAALARWQAANWPAILGGNIAIAAKLDSKNWIHVPTTNPHV